ncbi:hypothetical protein OV203_20420 [Nannocystis sp. ILAH1]|uniref:hypothetical protein n=1 Tax=Nannocystis sp. ILAH1 TaxID=2996789 RepID=UPI00226E3853|nr:hypothetical protein [Nannocystis sp. ILAH1]MCY0989517.1 hypothetical protein [Nannocystis sp. ILAH1]
MATWATISRMGRPLLLRFAAFALLIGCACGGDASGSGFSSSMPPGVTTAPMGSDGSSGGGDSTGSTGQDFTSSSTSSSSGVGSSGETKLDMPVPDGGMPAPLGCQGKIDFLFVISSSGTMANAQQRLLAAYPDFIGAIEAEFADFDRHILVTDGDAVYQMGDCSLCADPADCDPGSMEKSCGIPLQACDKKLGAGIVFPIGEKATNRRCDLFGGRRYIIEGEPDPLVAFECIATVGIGGAGYEVAGAMVAALTEDLNGYKGCNDGFLREDALLVVTLIKDNGDGFSEGEPEDWVEALYAAKGGDKDAVLVLVLTSDSDIWPSLCNPGQPTHPTGRLRVFADAVEHGYIGSICAPSYGPFFADAVSKVRPLCDALIPQ